MKNKSKQAKRERNNSNNARYKKNRKGYQKQNNKTPVKVNESAEKEKKETIEEKVEHVKAPEEVKMPEVIKGENKSVDEEATFKENPNKSEQFEKNQRFIEDEVPGSMGKTECFTEKLDNIDEHMEEMEESKEKHGILIPKSKSNEIKVMSKENHMIEAHNVHRKAENIEVNIAELEGEKYLVKTGHELLDYLKTKSYSQFTPRRHHVSLVRFCASKNRMLMGKMVMVTGLRGTGKTTLLFHTIDSLMREYNISASDIVYISIMEKGTNMSNLCNIISKVKAKHVFVDNITKVDDFVERSYLLTERVSDFKKLVITGDNTYALNVASKDGLCNRTIKMGTNMLFYEFARLFGHEHRDMSKKEIIAQFMTRDFMSGNVSYDGIGDPYRYMRDVILKETIAEMAKDPERLSKWGRGMINLSEYKLVYIAFMTILRVDRVVNFDHCISSNKELRKQVERAMVKYAPLGDMETMTSVEQNMEPYCAEMLKLLVDAGVITAMYNIVDTDETIGIEKETDIQYICNIPSLLYSLTCASSVGSTKDMTDNILGRLNENIVASQCCIWAERRDDLKVYYARYNVSPKAQRVYGDTNVMPEIDVVLQKIDVNDAGKIKKKHILIEVKTNSHVNAGHTKNMNSGSVDAVINNVVEKYCVYGGQTGRYGSVQYINMYDFISRLDKWISFE